MNLDLKENIAVPEGVTVSVDKHTLKVEGPKGTLEKKIRVPRLSFKVEGNEVILESKAARKPEKTMLKTYKALLLNWLKGVVEGHDYKLKICSGHFPMAVSLKGDTLEVKNFIGEAVPRHLKIKQGAEVKVDGDTIKVSGFDKELVSQTAADIEQLCKRPGFDKRIFQDGIYITEKDGKVLVV